MKLSYTTLLSIPILSSSKKDLLVELSSRIQEKKSFTIFTPNPEIVVKARNDKQFASILQVNEFNIPDGFGITLFTGIPIIKGRMLMEDLFQLLNKERKSLFIIGSESIVIEKVLDKIKQQYPNVIVNGHPGPQLNHDGTPKSTNDVLVQQEVENKLEQLKPTMVFVGFGAPKQEYWVAIMKKKFPLQSWMVVGGALDTYSGKKYLPPKWIEYMHVEWVYRLLQEPQRLGRILNAIIVFPFLYLLSKVNRT